jgi:hypothetical protein
MQHSSLAPWFIPTRARLHIAVAGIALAACGAPFASAAPAAPQFKPTGPVLATRESQFDFVSQLNGLAYRVMISGPKTEPGKTYPVLYVLDGNWYFRAASDTATWGSGPFEPAIVVGIGYPTEDYAEVRRRRALDLSVREEPKRFPDGSGGCDTFLRMIEQDIKPFVASRHPIDPKRQMLYGKSLGGLAALRALLRYPTTFGTYVIVSPSIWQGNKAVLEDEAAFAARARAGELDLRILITSASEEEYTGTDPAKLAAEQAFMITNARNLADRLRALAPGKVEVRYVLFQDENHSAVSLASIGRAISFALPAPPPRPR